VLTALAALALLAPTAPQETVRVDADARLAPDLREALTLIDPARAGWTSEVWSDAASARLKLLAQGLAAGSPPDLDDFATADFTCTDLVLAGDADVLFEDDTYRVRRGPPARGTSDASGPARLAAALDDLARRWSRAGEVPSFELKVDGVQGDVDGFTTRIRVHAHGPAARGEEDAGASWLLEHTARWSANWEAAEGEAPRLTSIDASDLEEVRARRTLLVTDQDFFGGGDFLSRGGELPLDYGWGEGTDGLRRRLDRRLGLPLLGAPSGIAVGDVDGDGREDLYLAQPGGLPNRLLLARADGGVDDRSAGSGADLLDFTRSALLVDLDGDGDRDLAVALGAHLLLLANDGKGRFERKVSFEMVETTSLAAADYDLDGDLDLYACAYFTPYDGTALPRPYHDANNGHANTLFENRGDWAFADVTAARGLDVNNRRFSFAAAWEDYDRDGDPDLYVANDFGRNNLYRNDGGTFVDAAAQAGIEDISAGMGVAWGDYDGDGWFDIYVTNMDSAAGNRVAYQRRFHAGAGDDVLAHYRRHARGNSLFRNLGDGTFADMSESAGVTHARWAWGARFVDWNGDGALDLLSPNGFLTGERADDL
jgi:hypothetical protein